MGARETTRLVEALRRPLIAAARGGFGGLDGFGDLGERLRSAVDGLLTARGVLPPERVGPVTAWRKVLGRFERLTRDEQEIEVARGMRLCVAIGGPAPPVVVEEPAPVAATAPASASPLEAHVRTIPGIGPKLAARLVEKGLETIEDLTWFVPRRYDDLRRVVPLADALAAPPGERATVVGTVRKVRFVRWGRRFVLVELGDADAMLVARWFNVGPPLANRFVVGRRAVLSGVVRVRNGVAEMANPDVLGDPDHEDISKRQVIRPRYAEVEGVPGALVRRAAAIAAARAAPHLVDGVPREVATRLALPPLGDALKALHAPPNDLGEEAARGLDHGESEWHRRLAFDELFFLGLAIARRRAERRTRDAGPCLASDDVVARAIAALPFALTGAQRRTIDEVRRDLAEARPMNRLLQGDVGAGKTAVAFVSAAIALGAGRQVAIMAPTEILAEQHLATLEPWIRAIGKRVALLTASTPKGSRESILGMLAAGALDVVIGTHALLAERVAFSDLGLVVIDEQHRFGVAQRVRLRGKGDEQVPHLLVMTATPIPRTLALTFYGDLDASILDELPPGRTPPVTKVLGGQRGHDEAYKILKRELKAGASAFVVCPLVEPSETETDWADATTTAERLADLLAPARVGLVHGRMSRAEREAAMLRLRRRELDVLVATTVIEVGVDIPHARVMIVEDADRFGLAQLHQLRGRVGRGGGTSHCLLLTRGARTSDAARRLAVLAETCDGFEIAEEDLAIRGPGEVLGVKQAGLPKLRFGDLVRHAALAAEARAEADRLLASDPRLERPEHADTRCVLDLRSRVDEHVGAESG